MEKETISRANRQPAEQEKIISSYSDNDYNLEFINMQKLMTQNTNLAINKCDNKMNSSQKKKNPNMYL